MPVLMLLLSLVSPYLAPQADPAGWTEHSLIAHAMGGIDGNAMTNSYDAFIANYEKGFRVFEVDLNLTSDGYLAARHDWGAYLYAMFGQDKPDVKDKEPISLEEFKSLMIDKKYRPLEFADIVKLLERFPDAYIVTDTKELKRKKIQKQFQIIADTAEQIRPDALKRVVPQIYDQRMYGILEEIHPFQSYIYTLYESDDTNEEVIEFVKKTPKIRAVTMPENRVSQHFIAELKKAGVKTYVHTVNDYFIYDSYLKLGIDGIYTDFLDRQKIELARLQHPEQEAALVSSTKPAHESNHSQGLLIP